MEIALKKAQIAASKGDVPVGCVILDKNNKIIASGYNQKEKKQDVTLHAEIIAIKKAEKKLNNWRLDGCTIIITLSPCLMCLGAIVSSRIKTVVIGTYDNSSNLNLRIFKDILFENNINLIDHIKEEECEKILKNFFMCKRF